MLRPQRTMVLAQAESARYAKVIKAANIPPDM